MNKKQPTTDPTLADVLGGGLAVMQHGMDKIVSWGFTKMQRVKHDKKPATESTHPHLRRAARVGRGIIGFIADTGQAYYSSYEEIKRSSKKNS